jgi:hypothetical protein
MGVWLRRLHDDMVEQARSLGHSHIALNVFGGNHVARSLYRSLGYAETPVFMCKTL